LVNTLNYAKIGINHQDQVGKIIQRNKI